MYEENLNSAFNLMRRMPPANTVKSLAGIMELCPDISEDLLANVDQPLQVVMDKTVNKEYIICDYNRDGDVYRSPYSNKYFTEDFEEADGFIIPEQLRQWEIEANNVFDIYRHLYFDTGLSSVYFFESDNPSEFGAAFLIHKDVDANKTLNKGVWDSTHIFKVAPTKTPNEYEYTLTSTIIVSMKLNDSTTGNVDLSGSMTQQFTRKLTTDKYTTHIVNMGSMLEDVETSMRNKIEIIYIQKTREVLAGARSSTGARDAAWADITASLKKATIKND